MPQDVLYLFLLNVLMLTQVVNIIYFHRMVNCCSIFHKTLISPFFFFFNMVTPSHTVPSPKSHITILATMRFWEFYRRHLMNTWNKHTSMPTTLCKRRQRQKGAGGSSAVEDIRHPLPTVSVHLYSLPYSTFKSLHTDSLLGENESEQARIILSTGSEQPKIKYLYLIWSLRIES